MPKTLVEQFISDPTNMRAYQQERAIYEVTELLEDVIHENYLSRSDLAKRLETSAQWATKLLDGKNKSIRTMADAFAAIGYELHFSCVPIADVIEKAKYESQRHAKTIL